MPNFANILGLLGIGQQPQGYQPDPQTLGLLNQLNRGPDGLQGAPNTDPEKLMLQQQLNRGPDGMPAPFGLLNQPQSSQPLPIFAQGGPQPDMPAPGAMPAGPAEMPPMPPQRPAGLGFNTPVPPERPANLPAQNATPAGPAAPAAAMATPGKPDQSGMEKFSNLLGSIYGQGGPGDSLIALGAGLASGPNWGQGLMRGMSMVNANSAIADKRALEKAQAQQKLLGISGGMETLRKTYPGLTDAQYASLAQNPQVMTEAAKRLGGADVVRPVTDPAERARLGIDPNDKSVYQIDRDGKLSAVGTPQNNVNVNTASDPVLKGLGDQVIEGRKNASTAVETIRSIHAQRDALSAPGGIISGFGAEGRLNLAKAGAILGITDPAKIANTEVFRAEAGNAVLSSIKALGANPSNSDREFIEKVRGGSITLDESTMRRLLDMQEKYARESITKHNELAGKMVKSIPGLQNVAGALSVDTPGDYQPKQQQPAAQQSPAQQPAKRPSWRIVQ